MTERAGSGARRARANDLVVQLCGEVLLQAPPNRQPPVVRAAAPVGLGLLDLLLNPDHVLRMTEELVLRTSRTLGRRVQADVSLDRLSRQQEERAMQLSALASDRVGPDAGAESRSGQLWAPLGVVPRPVGASIEITAQDGKSQPRPPQRDLRRALDASLQHVLGESLRAHPDASRPGSPVNLTTRDLAARWLLQSALLSVADIAPGMTRCHERVLAVRYRLPGLDVAHLSADGLRDVLGKLAGDLDGSSRQLALLVLRDAVMDDLALLDLVELVRQHHFVVAGLDRTVRDHSLQLELPEAPAEDEASDTPTTGLVARNVASLDPRNHNLTVHVLVPLPENVDQYDLHVLAGGEPDGAGGRDVEVSLIGVVHFDEHPGRTAIDTLLACADELDGRFHVAATTGTAATAVSSRLAGPYVARRADAAVDALDDVVVRQERAADNLSERWARTEDQGVWSSVRQVWRASAEARVRIEVARVWLDRMAHHDPLDWAPGRVAVATMALRDAAQAVEHPLLRTHLVSSELPGQEVGVLRPERAGVGPGSRPRTLEVWATLSDVDAPYGSSTVGPPLILAILYYLTGWLLFESWLWYLSPSQTLDMLPEVLQTGATDAIVAVLLLIPAYAVTQLRGRSSVADRLGGPARPFVFVTIVVVAATAMVVATQVGGQPEHGGGHPHLVLWTFRIALIIFLAWTYWASWALLMRFRYVWRPKGLQRYFGAAAVTAGHPGRWSRVRIWLLRPVTSLRYDAKAPDAAFDLRLPGRSSSSSSNRSRW